MASGATLLGGALLRLCCAYFIMCFPVVDWGFCLLWMNFCWLLRKIPGRNHSHVPILFFLVTFWAPIELEEDGAFYRPRNSTVLLVDCKRATKNRCPLTKTIPSKPSGNGKSAVKSSGRPKQTSPGVCSPFASFEKDYNSP